MFKRFLPITTDFFYFFEGHAALTVQAVHQLKVACQEGGDAQEGAKEIERLEKEADSVAYGCIQALHKTFITPFERDAIII